MLIVIEETNINDEPILWLTESRIKIYEYVNTHNIGSFWAQSNHNSEQNIKQDLACTAN